MEIYSIDVYSFEELSPQARIRASNSWGDVFDFNAKADRPRWDDLIVGILNARYKKDGSIVSPELLSNLSVRNHVVPLRPHLG